MSSIEEYNRKIKQKKFVVHSFATCPVCRADKMMDKKPCGKNNCPYDIETRGRKPKNH